MNISIIFIPLLALFACSYAWKVTVTVEWKRARKAYKCSAAPVRCARTCKQTGAGRGVNCYFSCLKKCEGLNEDPSTKNAHLVPMPIDFNFYDCRGEGRFDVICLAAVFNEDPEDETLMKMFRVVDQNKDGFITPDELKTDIWIFEGHEKKEAEETGDAVDPPKELSGPSKRGMDSEAEDLNLESRNYEEQEDLTGLVDRLDELLREEP